MIHENEFVYFCFVATNSHYPFDIVFSMNSSSVTWTYTILETKNSFCTCVIERIKNFLLANLITRQIIELNLLLCIVWYCLIGLDWSFRTNCIMTCIEMKWDWIRFSLLWQWIMGFIVLLLIEYLLLFFFFFLELLWF